MRFTVGQKVVVKLRVPQSADSLNGHRAVVELAEIGSAYVKFTPPYVTPARTHVEYLWLSVHDLQPVPKVHPLVPMFLQEVPS